MAHDLWYFVQMMAANSWFTRKFRVLKLLAVPAGVGLVCIAFSIPRLEENSAMVAFFLVGIFFLAPGLFYACVMTVWHWKDRYVGQHSNLRGAILLIETSGWFKIVYWFRHILPDAQGKGRYAKNRIAAQGEPSAE